MSVKLDILSALAYFDLFDYPLTKREIWLFLKSSCNNEEVTTALSDLTAIGIIFKIDDMYSLQNIPSVVWKRREGNTKAVDLMHTARKVARLLSKFPFVRGVGVSGSLSKNVATDLSDIDLFIITAENKLWLARTIMHFFKKLTFLLNKQHLFCMNYYVDEKVPEIEEKNIYTATELVTLIPLQGELTFKNFYSGNSWSKTYLPNHFLRISATQKENFSFLKVIVEKILDNHFGDWLDNYLMNITAKRWNKKTLGNRKNMKGITLSMIAKKHLAKPDPSFFQNLLLSRHTERVAQLAKQLEETYANKKPYQKV